MAAFRRRRRKKRRGSGSGSTREARRSSPRARIDRRRAGRWSSTARAKLHRRRRWWPVAQGSIRPGRGSLELGKGAEETRGAMGRLGARGIDKGRRGWPTETPAMALFELGSTRAREEGEEEEKRTRLRGKG